MAGKNRNINQKGNKNQRESVCKEAWDNMSTDFERTLPEKLRNRSGKKKFALWLLILELAILGGVGKLIQLWWMN